MASKRCLPTRFFKDPDIMNLASRDSQLILVGLVLMADDEGRELAHAKLLSRELDYSPEQIETALTDLEANDLVVLYQVGRHRYYSLTRWRQWQTISRDKMTLSKYPAPPAIEDGTPLDEAQQSSESPSQHSPAIPTEPPGNFADSQHFPSQGNSSESNSSESNAGEAAQPPHNVLTFPADRRDTTTSTDGYKFDDHHHAPQTQHTTREVAAILRLPTDDALVRIVQDYQHDPLLRLLGEADAAREYIDDPRRNRRGQRMTPAFFRRWLRREHEDAMRRQTQRETTAATGTTGNGARAAPPPEPGRPILPKSLMHLADQAQLGHTSAPASPQAQRAPDQ
jgi:DNA-binding transcriptional ArsR family regulator